ncbi:MAG: hypothetical protein ACRD68_01650 [Pyrinomonadaceae bacterium]
MSDDVLAYPLDHTSSLERPRALDTILYGGLAAGALDITYALIFSGLRGVSPSRVLQFIASGLLGRAAFGGGPATALLGLLLHFLIAFILAGIYYGASLYLPALVRRAVVCGLVYGVAVYFVMNYVVLPLSATPKLNQFPLASFVGGLLIHAFGVGLPIALFARRSARAS